jgi:hypothetical protein
MYWQTDLCRNLNEDRWLVRLDASRWLQNVQRLVSTAYRVAEAIDKDVSPLFI